MGLHGPDSPPLRLLNLAVSTAPVQTTMPPAGSPALAAGLARPSWGRAGRGVTPASLSAHRAGEFGEFPLARFKHIGLRPRFAPTLR